MRNGGIGPIQEQEQAAVKRRTAADCHDGDEGQAIEKAAAALIMAAKT